MTEKGERRARASESTPLADLYDIFSLGEHVDDTSAPRALPQKLAAREVDVDEGDIPRRLLN